MTTVKHEEYWPAILADPTQYGQIQTADAAWNARAACVFEVLKNTLCARDNAILTQQWENTLELSPADGATLNERKAVILYRLTEAPPLTIALLEKSLILLMGEGKAVVEHLPAENKLVVHTDRADDTQLEAVTALLARVLPQNIEVVQYNHNMEISWRDINKYAECVTVAAMLAVNPDYKNDLTSDGEWVYPLPNLENASYAFAGAGELRKLHIAFPKAKTLNHMLSASYGDKTHKKLEDVCIEAPVENVNVEALFQSNFGNGYSDIKKFKCVFANALKIDKLFHGITTQTSLEIICPRITSAKDAFSGLKLDKPSTLNIFNQLQAFTSGSHPLTIGIHVDHQSDEEVLAAIANAEAKGWTLTVQWNGTPTAQASVTYGLRKPPIYAKVSEMERPDGTTERILDWGHYVTDPTGYEEFRSVEEAREHYGLPAEDEAITE